MNTKLIYTMEEASDFFEKERQRILVDFKGGRIPQGDILERAYYMELVISLSYACNVNDSGLFLTENQLDQMLEKASEIARNASEEILDREVSITASEFLEDLGTFVCDDYDEVMEIVDALMRNDNRLFNVEMQEDRYVIIVTG